MDLRFYINVVTRLPHIYDHYVTESEVRDVLRKPLEEFRGRRESMVAQGQTQAGRYLKVIYVLDKIGSGIFVVTDTTCRAGRSRP